MSKRSAPPVRVMIAAVASRPDKRVPPPLIVSPRPPSAAIRVFMKMRSERSPFGRRGGQKSRVLCMTLSMLEKVPLPKGVTGGSRSHFCPFHVVPGRAHVHMRRFSSSFRGLPAAGGLARRRRACPPQAGMFFRRTFVRAVFPGGPVYDCGKLRRTKATASSRVVISPSSWASSTASSMRP